MSGRRSVVDGCSSLTLHLGQVVPHGLEHLGGMAVPVLDLADDPQRLAGPIRLGGVAGEALVGQVGVVLEGAGGFNDVDSPAPRPWPAPLPRRRRPGLQ